MIDLVIPTFHPAKAEFGFVAFQVKNYKTKITAGKVEELLTTAITHSTNVTSLVPSAKPSTNTSAATTPALSYQPIKPENIICGLLATGSGGCDKYFRHVTIPRISSRRSQRTDFTSIFFSTTWSDLKGGLQVGVVNSLKSIF